MKKLRKLIRLIKFNQKARNFAILCTVAIILTISIVVAMISISNHRSTTASASNKSTENDFTYITPAVDKSEDITDVPEPVVDKEVKAFVPATKVDLDPSSITVYVNKEFSLSKEYKPDNLVTPNIRFNLQTYDDRTMMRAPAAKAIEKLFAAAEQKGLYLVGVSGYRSYERQYKIFTNNLVTKGKIHTLKYSAVPGTSEHQTGLAMDCSTESLRYDLTDQFADSPEGKWLAKNAYKYGFIIRYPKDKVDITGYAYEPWHIRYVGRGLSYYLYKHKLTLDEYYKYTPSSTFNFEKQYAEILNYKPPVRVVTKAPTVTPTPEPTKEPDGKKGGKKGNKGTSTGNNKGTTEATPIPTPASENSQTPTVTDIPEDTGNSAASENSTGDNSDTSGESTDELIN